MQLSVNFFIEIIEHPVPIDMNTLAALKRSPLGLDLYLWLAYRTFTLQHPLRLTWKQIYHQFGTEPAKSSDNQTVQNFRYKALRELKQDRSWPGRRLELRNGQRRLGRLPLNTHYPANGSSSTHGLGS